jgi:hypothetical protein
LPGGVPCGALCRLSRIGTISGVDAVEVLVSLKHEDVTVGVVRDRDGRVWLSSSLERVAGTGLSDYRPRQQGLHGDRTLIGGRLAPGAVTPEVIDDAGTGIPLWLPTAPGSRFWSSRFTLR